MLVTGVAHLYRDYFRRKPTSASGTRRLSALTGASGARATSQSTQEDHQAKFTSVGDWREWTWRGVNRVSREAVVGMWRCRRHCRGLISTYACHSGIGDRILAELAREKT